MLFCVLLFSCDIRNTKKRSDAPAANMQLMDVDTTTVGIIDSAYNFGKVVDGEMVEYSFRFKNTGKFPLVIHSATASCGCTVPTKPEKPVQPGEISFIKAVFNSAGRVGDVHKEIRVVSNARPLFPVLKLTGEVVSKESLKSN